jgi:hypothetical protein
MRVAGAVDGDRGRVQHGAELVERDRDVGVRVGVDSDDDAPTALLRDADGSTFLPHGGSRQGALLMLVL